MRAEWPLFVVLVFALLVTTYELTEAPPTWYDEGMILQLAQNTAVHGVYGQQVAPGTYVSGAFTSTGFPVVLPVALSYKLFGVSLLAARSVMVVSILGLIAASYVLLRKFGRQDTAILGTALLATFPSLYGDGKSVLGEVTGLFFLVVALIGAHSIFEQGKISRATGIWAGLFFGLCLATKPTFFVAGGAALLALLFVVLVQKKRIPWSTVGWGVGAAILPLVFWFAMQFGPGDTLARVLEFYANPYKIENLSAVIAQNIGRFFIESTPMYLLALWGGWVLSLIYRVWKKIHISFVEVFSFAFVLLIIAAYVRTPGWYRYLFPAQIIAMIFFPLALSYVSNLFTKVSFRKWAERCVWVLVGALVLMQAYLLFFNSFISDYFGVRITAHLEEYFANYDTSTSFFIYDVPQAPTFLPPGAPYYQYMSVNAEGYWEIGAEELAVLESATPDIVVISAMLKEREAELFPRYKEKEEVENLIILERR